MGALHTVTEQAHGNQFHGGRICASSQILATDGSQGAPWPEVLFHTVGREKLDEGRLVHHRDTQVFGLRQF